MNRIFKTRHFNRWMRKSEITDRALCEAVLEMERGLIDADLGGRMLKKRVPLPGHGKSGSARVLVATNRSDRWFYIFGFEKNGRANVTAKELKALQEIASDLLALSSQALDTLVASKALEEIYS